jgi:hypothetical protein
VVPACGAFRAPAPGPHPRAGAIRRRDSHYARCRVPPRGATPGRTGRPIRPAGPEPAYGAESLTLGKREYAWIGVIPGSV